MENFDWLPTLAELGIILVPFELDSGFARAQIIEKY